MSGSVEQRFLAIVSGEAAGAAATISRGVLAAAEPFYAGLTRARNRMFDAGIRPVHRLNRPVISIGNITTGGTGKTPVVRWLAGRLRAEGRRVAILSRGYRASPGTFGDELAMLDRSLNASADLPVFVRAGADRFATGAALLREHPEIDVFLLDDGFQHRRLARDLDVVLLNAAEPFGFGHVLPRGLLREPASGLRRAGAIVLTHADQATPGGLAAAEAEVRRYNPDAPIYRAIHAPAGLRGGAPDEPEYPAEELSRRRFFAFGGIGNPAGFERHLRRFGPTGVGHQWFGDHHAYTQTDMAALAARARAAGAEVLVTTEKDWVKVEPFAAHAALPVWRADVRIEFLGCDELRLLEQIRSSLGAR